MKDKNKLELVRVNINLPKNVIERVRDYADELGIPMTQAYIVLINMALQQKDIIAMMPALMKGITDLKMLSENQETSIDNE